ncbi:MAG: hypothetical protein ACFB6R_04355 [Alphaproteobacteria bacterium]
MDRFFTLLTALMLVPLLATAPRAETQLPASDLNVARTWYALADQSPDFEALVKASRRYTSANQFDRADVYQTMLGEVRQAFETGFNGNELLTVNLAIDVAKYDFERMGFPIRAFDGNTFIPTASPFLALGRGRMKLDGSEYRIVFDNPEPYAFMDLQPDAARALLNGRNSKRLSLTAVLQPISAQVDQVRSGYSNKTMRTVIARVVSAEIRDKDTVVWQKAEGAMDTAAIAAAAQQSGQVIDITEQTVKTIWHRLKGTTPDFTLEASKTSAFRSANRFDQQAVLDAEVLKAERRFADFVPNARLFAGRIRTRLSDYDAAKGGFNVSLFSGASYIEGGLFFQNAGEFAFIPMAPREADAFLDRHGPYPSVIVDFEAQPVAAQAHLTDLASLTRDRRVQSYLTKVVLTAESKGQRTELVNETRPPLDRQDIASIQALPASIDTALPYEGADIVLTWARAAGKTPDFQAWAQASRDYRSADNEFVRQRLLPRLVDQRKEAFGSYALTPWRVRLAARLSEYDFNNQRFEIQNVAFDRTLVYRDGLRADLFGQTPARDRTYELKLANLGDLRFFSIPPAKAEEILTQMGRGRSVTLDMLVYPTRAVHKAPWGEKETRLVEATITDVRLLGQSRRYGGEVSRLYETTIATPPRSVAADVAVDRKPHIDPRQADIKGLRLGMSRREFESAARKIFGRIEPYKGQQTVLRFESADGESGYAHFDPRGTLAFLQYYRTLPGRGRTDAVAQSVIKKYGTPFDRENRSIGSHIKYAYLYFSDPAELGLDPKEKRVGLWVEIQESDQLRPITQLEINLGTKP